MYIWVESLNIITEFNSEVNTFNLEVKNLESGWEVLLSNNSTPCSLINVELPSKCNLITRGSISNIACPRDKETVSDAIILVLQYLESVGYILKTIRMIEKSQTMLDYSKIVEVYSRDESVIFE